MYGWEDIEGVTECTTRAENQLAEGVIETKIPLRDSLKQFQTRVSDALRCQ